MRRISLSPRELLALDDAALLDQCEIDLYRSSGPGGQKRNKTSSAVRLRHPASGLVVTASEERSQHVNKARAIRRLREAIALHLRQEMNADDYAPSELLRSCIQNPGSICVGRRDQRYSLAVCEVLDVLATCSMAVSQAAERIGMTTAQLVKFFESNPKLWERVNEMRASVGANALR